MARTELQDLLPADILSRRSRSEVLQQLSIVSAGPTAETAAGSAAADTASGALQGPLKDVTQQLAALTSEVTALSSIQQNQTNATQDNTQALAQNTSAKSGGSSVAGTVESIASSFLGGGFGLSPIVSGLLSLFGGGDSQTPSVIPPFRLPLPVDYQAGLTGGSPAQVVPVDAGQYGQTRTQAPSPSAQVNIQVNAVDSRSFLDHSEEIARAVKEAILSSNALNDVISDL